MSAAEPNLVRDRKVVKIHDLVRALEFLEISSDDDEETDSAATGPAVCPTALRSAPVRGILPCYPRERADAGGAGVTADNKLVTVVESRVVRKMHIQRKSSFSYFDEEVTRKEAERLAGSRVENGRDRAIWRQSDISIVDLTGDE